MPEIRERFSLGESHAAGVRDLTRFILIPGFATALDLFPVPILVLTACGALEIKVRAAPVLAQKALTHGGLTRTDVVKERGGSIWPIAPLRTPVRFKGVVIAAALVVVDGEQCGEVIHMIWLLVDAVAAGSLADLKIAYGIERQRLAAPAAFVVTLRALQGAYRDHVAAYTQFAW